MAASAPRALVPPGTRPAASLCQPLAVCHGGSESTCPLVPPTLFWPPRRPPPRTLEDSGPRRVCWRGTCRGRGLSEGHPGTEARAGPEPRYPERPHSLGPHHAFSTRIQAPVSRSTEVGLGGSRIPQGSGWGWGSQVPRETTPPGGCRKDRPGWSGEQAQQTDPHRRGISLGREQDDPIQERARQRRGAEGGARGSCPAEAGGRGRRPRCRAGPSSWQVCSCPLGLRPLCLPPLAFLGRLGPETPLRQVQLSWAGPPPPPARQPAPRSLVGELKLAPCPG